MALCLFATATASAQRPGHVDWVPVEPFEWVHWDAPPPPPTDPNADAPNDVEFRIHLLAITNESTDAAAVDVVDKADTAGADPKSFWCRKVLDDNLSTLRFRLPVGRVLGVRRIAKVGLPSSLTDRQRSPVPERLILIAFDDSGRLLNLGIGIRSPSEFESWMIDAFAMQQSLRESPDRGMEFIQHCQQINFASLDRFYTEVAETFYQDYPTIRTDTIFDAIEKIDHAFSEFYQRDLSMRFHLALNDSTPRQAILEQHSATRDAWCRCVLPAIAGRRVESIMQPLAEFIWQQPILLDQPHDPQLVREFESASKEDLIVLHWKGTWHSALQRRVLAAIPDEVQRGQFTYRDIDQRLQQWHNRDVDARDLVALQAKGWLTSLDWQTPAAVSHVIWRSGQRQQILRFGEPPPRQWGRIRAMAP